MKQSITKHLLALLPGIVGLAVLLPAVADAQVVLVAPPPAYREVAPEPRAGQDWHPGYWQWEHNRYTWTRDTWSPHQGAMTGAYRAPEARMLQPPRVERLSADALFPFDRGDVSDIRPSGMADIAQIAAHLRASPFSHVEVRGYADTLGKAGYNLDLSVRRANAVKTALIQHGVPAEKIRSEGLGSQDPIAKCDRLSADALVQCLQPDRRVEIVTYVRDDPRGQQQLGERNRLARGGWAG